VSLRSKLGLARTSGNPSASVYAIALGMAAGSSSLLAVSTGFVDLFDGSLDVFEVWPMAGLCLALTIWLLRDGVVPRRTRGSSILAATVVGWLALVLISTFVYIATGSISRFDDALFESTAGFTTTHLSVIGDIENVAQPMLWWRSGTQWVGGLAALVLGTTILPFWVNGREMVDPEGSGTGFKSFAPNPSLGIRNALRFYGGFTLLCALGLVVSGAGFFDAITYGMSTVSTGGFANHPDSIAHFNSPLMEWLVSIMMLIAGSSIALVWWMLRGSPGSMLRSLEARLYGGAVLVATIFFTMAELDNTANNAGLSDAIRHGWFSATAVVSTTGHWSTNWSGWGTGSTTLLLLLVGIGSMAGSIGGGYRWLHVAESLEDAKRAITLQLHPTAHKAVKVGNRAASERSIDQMHAQRTLIGVTVGTGAALLGVFGADLVEAFSLSVSALSTFGPALGEMAAASFIGDQSWPARLTLALLMFAGRLSIYPIPLVLGSVIIWCKHRAHDAATGYEKSERTLLERLRRGSDSR